MTTDTVTAAATSRPLSGATLSGIRTWLLNGQDTLADHLHVSAEALRAYEAGHQLVPDPVADALAHRVQAALDVMTDAELRATRDHLGLTPDELSTLLQVHPRKHRRLEAGHHTVPAHLAARLRDLIHDADHDVAVLTTWLRHRDGPHHSAAAERPSAPDCQPEPIVLLTARSDHALTALAQTGDPIAAHAPTATWHRAIARRAAATIPGTRLRYTASATTSS